MGNIPGLAGILGFVIALGTLLGVSLRSGRQTSTINNYREAATAWEMKANAQETQIADLQQTVGQLQHDLTTVQAENSVLRDLVTGKEALATIGTQLSEWQDEIRARLAGIDKTLASLPGKIGNGNGHA